MENPIFTSSSLIGSCVYLKQINEKAELPVHFGNPGYLCALKIFRYRGFGEPP